jgi:hypothetical protein
MIFIEIQAIEMKGFFLPSRIGCFDDGKFEVAFGKKNKRREEFNYWFIFYQKGTKYAKKTLETTGTKMDLKVI